ncbi:MAG: hypothetical protein SFU86_24215 [Pirellulaceae bacterium]|nr:hypothetical protein [Pirellulaceae bacterium]
MFRLPLANFAFAAAAALLTPVASAQYRGMPAGWPQASGTFPQVAAAGTGFAPAYVVARPVQQVQFVPVRTAFANPAYLGAYNMPASAMMPVGQPATTAFMAPQTMVAPQAMVAPTTVRFSPTFSYAASPAGNVSSGAEAFAGFGQPQPINYVAPRVVYRTTMMPVTVYAWRPVTTYQPVTAQPTTCLQPAAPTTSCQTARSRTGFLSWLNPFNWGSCGRSSGCGAAPTTSFCGAAACQPATTCGTSGCGQPYYPAQPTIVVPTTPGAIITTPPANLNPTIRSPIIGTPTVPSPPTRFPANTVPPADSRPSLPPGTIINPGTNPGSFNPAPSGGFPVSPPAGGFNPGPTGSFPATNNYPPATDPYSSGAALGTPQPRVEASGPLMTQPTPLMTPPAPVVTQPGYSPAPALNSSVQPVPDPAARQPKSPANRAPQLLDPRDKTARAEGRWGVVPAVWPSRPAASLTSSGQSRPYAERSYSQPSAPAINPADYDDGGWKSAR